MKITTAIGTRIANIKVKSKKKNKNLVIKWTLQKTYEIKTIMTVYRIPQKVLLIPCCFSNCRQALKLKKKDFER